jgi:hypothetical protein
LGAVFVFANYVKRLKHMSIPLSKLIKNIGTSVQTANQAIEYSAAKIYLGQGYTPTADKHELNPITYTLNMPSSDGESKQLNVPMTVLVHNTSLQLDSVEVKLKFAIEESGDEIAVTVKPENDPKSAFSLSELTLQFKTSPPTEGASRLRVRKESVQYPED